MKPILEIQHVSKKFRIHHENQPYLSIRDAIINTIKSSFNSLKTNPDEEFYALNDISFNVMPGESIGIIGKNGAGKSTLLKILSKITPPTSGKIISRGRIASLLEVGTGFHPELSGRENVFMNGSILGMSRKEIIKNFDAIVDFAGVEKFIDTPLKHYSSGMQLRLAFAVSAFLENEILIIDEVLAVGDAEFQKKCIGKMEDVTKSGRTILFVSHNMGSMAQLCSRGVLLKEGELIKNDTITSTINHYLSSKLETQSGIWEKKHTAEVVKKDLEFKKIFLTNKSNMITSDFFTDEDVNINFLLDIKKIEEPFSILVTIFNQIQQPVFSAETKILKEAHILKIKKFFLQEGRFSLKIFLHIPSVKCIEKIENCCEFSITDISSEWIKYNTHGYNHGSVFGNYEWT